MSYLNNRINLNNEQELLNYLDTENVVNNNISLEQINNLKKIQIKPIKTLILKIKKKF